MNTARPHAILMSFWPDFCTNTFATNTGLSQNLWILLKIYKRSPNPNYNLPVVIIINLCYQIKSETHQCGQAQLDAAMYGLWAKGQTMGVGVRILHGKVSCVLCLPVYVVVKHGQAKYT